MTTFSPDAGLKNERQKYPENQASLLIGVVCDAI